MHEHVHIWKMYIYKIYYKYYDYNNKISHTSTSLRRSLFSLNFICNMFPCIGWASDSDAYFRLILKCSLSVCLLVLMSAHTHTHIYIYTYANMYCDHTKYYHVYIQYDCYDYHSFHYMIILTIGLHLRRAAIVCSNKPLFFVLLLLSQFSLRFFECLADFFSPFLCLNHMDNDRNNNNNAHYPGCIKCFVFSRNSYALNYTYIIIIIILMYETK